MAEPSRAFAVTGYRRAAFSSHPTSRPAPTARQIAIWTGGFSHPLDIE